MTFGQKLQQLRKARGLSQEDLARQLSVTRQTISKWELDQSTPDLPYLAAISEVFGVSTDFLIKESLTESDAPPPQKKPLTAQEKKSCSKQQVVLNLFLASLGGIVFPMLIISLMDMLSLRLNVLNDLCELTFVLSAVFAPIFGIGAAILALQERKPME